MQLRNDELAERILEAAKSEFLEKGYRQASVRSIAASVGVTTGALYRYYANKEALFDALVSGPADYLYDQCKSFRKHIPDRSWMSSWRTFPSLPAIQTAVRVIF